MRFSITQALDADFGALFQQSETWRRQGETLDQQNTTACFAVDTSTDYWLGGTASTARECAQALGSLARAIASSHAEAADVSGSGAQRLAELQGLLRTAVAEARTTGHTVNEDGTVESASAVAQMPPGSSIDDLAAQQVLLDSSARVFADRISTLTGGLSAADDDTTRAIQRAFGSLPAPDAINSVKLSFETSAQQGSLTADQGTADGETIADGKLSDDERTRIASNLAQTRLTPTQLAAIADGQEVELPAGTLQYLTNLYNSAGRDGLLEVSDTLYAYSSNPANPWPDMRSDLANGMLTISNEHIVSKDGDTFRGGYDKLDSEIRELIGSRPGFDTDPIGDNGAPDRNVRELPDDYRGDETPGEWYKDMGRLASFLNSSDTAYIPGKELAVDLDRQAAHQMWVLDNTNLDIGLDPQRGWERLVEGNGEKLLDVGSRNHEASTVLFTGDGLEDGYDAANVARPLFTHDWRDDGATLNKLYEWIADDALVDNPLDTADVARAERAGAAADGLATLLSSDNFRSDLMSISTSDGQSLGSVNPHAVRGLANALSPYVAEIGGTADEYVSTRNFDFAESKNGKHLFALMNTDHVASEVFNANAYATIAELQAQFAISAIENPESPTTSLGEYAGRIGAMSSLGYEIEAEARSSDAASQQELRQTAFDRATSGADLIISLIPGSDFATPFIEEFKGSLESSFVGDVSAAETRDDNAVNDSDAAALYNVVHALEANGLLEPFPPLDDLRDPEGRLPSVENAAAVDSSDHDPATGLATIREAMSNYLSSRGIRVSEFLDAVNSGRDLASAE